MRVTKKRIVSETASVFFDAVSNTSNREQDALRLALAGVVLDVLKRTPLDQLSGKAGRLTKAERARWDALLAAAK